MAVFIVVYWNFNPENCKFFPPCPFRVLTGLKCPGCGSQRAIHYLLHGDIATACSKNLLVVIFIPYILFGFFLDWRKRLSPCLLKIQHIFYGTVAIWIVFSIIVVFAIARNIFKTF